MKYAFIDAHQDSFSIRRMCTLLEVSPSGYYDYRDRESSARAKRNAAITEKIKAIHTRSKGVYGSPRIVAALERGGEKVAIGTVKKIMQREGLRSKLSPRRKNPKRETSISKNLLTEEGDPSRPNQAWSGDFTYIWTQEGWLYLASVMDLYSRRIVGWAFGKQATKELVIQALDMGVTHRKPWPGLIFHSDKGSQYTRYAFKDALEEANSDKAMRGRGIALKRPGPEGAVQAKTNAKKERFYRSLKGEHLDHLELLTRDQAEREIFAYIEIFYNRERIHTVLGNLSPLEFESRTHPAQRLQFEAA